MHHDDHLLELSVIDATQKGNVLITVMGEGQWEWRDCQPIQERKTLSRHLAKFCMYQGASHLQRNMHTVFFLTRMVFCMLMTYMPG